MARIIDGKAQNMVGDKVRKLRIVHSAEPNGSQCGRQRQPCGAQRQRECYAVLSGR